MTFTSYAQNFEDVTLWRALKHVRQGRYVDIGAQHPVMDSISRAFYVRGWRGIHVETAPGYADLLRQDRPDEVVLQFAVSDHAGMSELDVVSDTDLRAGITEFSDQHLEPQGLRDQRIQSPPLAMSDALDALRGQDVHWLRINVEGSEETVLRGWDHKALRPWIIVIKVAAPASKAPNLQGAEGILVQAGYQFVCLDGPNRFYISSEHPELAAAFGLLRKVPGEVQLAGSDLCRGPAEQRRRPDVQSRNAPLDADERLVQAKVQIRALKAQLAQSAQKGDQAYTRAAQAEALAAQTRAQFVLYQQQIDAMLRSTSWRVSAPVRIAGAPLHRLTSAVREHRLGSGVKRRIVAAMIRAAPVLARRPLARRFVTVALSVCPPLHRRSRAVLALVQENYEQIRAAQGASPLDPSPDWRPLTLDDLNSEGRRTYLILRAATHT